MTYDGITDDSLLLLAQNRFENSKAFYEAHKAQIKQLVHAPLAQIVQALEEDLSKLDPRMVLAPSRVISRIRRDTRFTKEKHLYRDNMWIVFSRREGDASLKIWPCFWFEMMPEQGRWSAGVCIYDSVPAYMQFLRPRMESDSKAFLRCAKQAVAAGAALHSDPFKKDRAAGAPPALKPYLNAKSFRFEYSSHDMQQLAQPDFPETLRDIYKACFPMYSWLMRAAEEFLSQIT